MKMRDFFKVFLSVLFFASMGTKGVYCQVQRQVNSSTITKTTCALPSYIDEDSIGSLDWIYLERDDLERCTEQVINEENELTITNYYPQQPRWERDYEYQMGKSVSSKDGIVLYDHDGNEYSRLDDYNPGYILSQYEIEGYGIYNDLFDFDKEELIAMLQMAGYQVSEQDGFIIATYEDVEIAINLDELIVELRFFGEDDNDFFAEAGNKLQSSDRTDYVRTNNYVVPVKNTRVWYNTLPSEIPYEITEVESYLFYQVISENNTIVKTGNESIFNDCVKNSVTGIETTPQNTEIKIYPNPAATQLCVERFLQETADYAIYNIMGQTILQGKLSDDFSTINIEPLAKGMYYLKIAGKTMKFVKE